MSSQNNKKVPIDVHIDALLNESSQTMQESPGLKWEWEHYCKLETLISKIREREATRDATDVNNPNNGINAQETDNETSEESKHMDPESRKREKHFPAFLDWLRQYDINPDKVEISYKDPSNGFGMVTKVPIKAGDVVFVIPQRIILTSQVARESKLKILVEKDPLLSGMQNVLLAMFLIYERFVNPNIWKPYIDILPQSYETILYFTKEEMIVLKHSPSAFREALRMLRNVTRQYAYFHTKFRKANDSASKALKTIFTYNRYIWGVSAVTTRINHLPNPNNGEPILSLIPLWDICNHEDSELLCTDYNEENQNLICYAGHDYDENTEFTIFYGRRSSIDFLVHNGFVPNSYRHDFYYLELGVGMNDLNYNRKKAILSKIGLDCQNSFPVKPDRLMMAKKLFSFIRVFLADKDSLMEIEERQEDLTFLEEPTEACWKFLGTRFSLLKRAAENSLASTMKTLYGENSTNLPRVTKILLQLLKNEQKVLEMLMHFAECQQLKPAVKEDISSEETPSK